MTHAQVLAHVQHELGLSQEQLDELDADLWRWYVGELDRPLYDWFAGPRRRGLEAERLGVAPDEIAFLDDWLPAVEAARVAGWRAVHHVDTPASIVALEELLAG